MKPGRAGDAGRARAGTRRLRGTTDGSARRVVCAAAASRSRSRGTTRLGTETLASEPTCVGEADRPAGADSGNSAAAVDANGADAASYQTGPLTVLVATASCRTGNTAGPVDGRRLGVSRTRATRAPNVASARMMSAKVTSRVKICTERYAANPPTLPLSQSKIVKFFVPIDASTIPIAAADVTPHASAQTSFPVSSLNIRRQSHT